MSSNPNFAIIFCPILLFSTAVTLFFLTYTFDPPYSSPFMSFSLTSSPPFHPLSLPFYQCRNTPRLREFAEIFAVPACEFGDAIRHGFKAEPPATPHLTTEEGDWLMCCHIVFILWKALFALPLLLLHTFTPVARNLLMSLLLSSFPSFLRSLFVIFLVLLPPLISLKVHFNPHNILIPPPL